MIHFYNEHLLPLSLPHEKVNRWIKRIARDAGYRCGEIALIFCTDASILELNRQYLQHDYFTDIITFDYTKGDYIAGDIFISVETVDTNAKQYQLLFEAEMYRVIIHGVLHLCGQKDATELEKSEMTRRENEAIELLNKIAEI